MAGKVSFHQGKDVVLGIMQRLVVINHGIDFHRISGELFSHFNLLTLCGRIFRQYTTDTFNDRRKRLVLLWNVVQGLVSCDTERF